MRTPRLFDRRRIYLTLLVLAVAVSGVIVWRLRTDYEHNLQPVSAVTTTQYFTVQSGESLHNIALGLQDAGLVRSWSAFEWYVRSNELRDNLQAGTYSFSPSMSVETIAKKLASGDVSKNLLTILPGKRLDQVEAAFRSAGYSNSDVAAAFNSSTYAGDPALASLPRGKSLEGYLFPDSFQKGTNTPASTIVKESIDELATNLTADLKDGFKKQGLNTYQAITLASIVEQESGRASDDPTIAQVFLLRLKQGMPLGSDVTAKYASAIAGQAFDPAIKSPYNTRVVAGLPPGPIGSVSLAALKAVAAPAHSDYLYFVTGDNGNTYFSHTAQEHEQLIQKYCIKSCS